MLDGKSVRGETLTFDVATAAVKGAREYQEDSLVANFPIGQSVGFAILADGMGGHFSGHVASALVMAEAFGHLKTKEMLIAEGMLDIPATLTELAHAANNRVARHMEEDQETYGMGSTLLATVINGDALYWISIGDSPLFLFRDGALRQLNQDHSMAPQIDMMVAAGAMSAEKGRDHPDRNTLMSAVAGDEIAKIDCPEEPFQLEPGDIVIATSDGLQYLENDQILEILAANESKPAIEISNALIAAIDDLADPEQDNTAFSLVKLAQGVTAIRPEHMAPMPGQTDVEAADDPDEAEIAEEGAAEMPAEVAPAAALDEEPSAETAGEPETEDKPQSIAEIAAAEMAKAAPATPEPAALEDPNQPRRVKLIKSEKLSFYRDPGDEEAKKDDVEDVVEEPTPPPTVSLKSRLAALNGGTADAVTTDDDKESAEDATETVIALDAKTPSQADDAPEKTAEPDERKAYYYRGQKYYKD
ncbi:MAG: protein phosphatase 2C domain-containing protein [Pseudomonadota bacterium]